MDIAECLPADPDGLWHIRQPALHQYDLCRIDCHIGSCPDRDTNVCPCQCRRIVNSVAHHRHFAFFTKFADNCLFAIRQYTCDHFIDSCLLTDGFCRTLIVAGQHDNADSHLF